MFAIIKTEFLKIKRYHILLIGMIGMMCSPILQLFSQFVMTEEAKTPNFDFAALVENTLWGNAEIFMPVLFTLTGGYLINREYTDDTLKNILTVPLSFRKFLAGKLVSMSLLAMLFGIYCHMVTILVGLLAGLPNIRAGILISGLVKMTGLSLCVYIVVLPLITVCSRKPGLFMSGSVIAFLAGYCVLFFKSGLLRDIYPFSAALTVIGFDTSSYTGADGRGNFPLSALSLCVMFLAAVFLVCTATAPQDAGSAAASSKKKGLSLRPAQRERMKIR